ncbi:hypothetical protein M409DRAFT_29117 [Zasmidium cellare ATCC 36951]|uniref:Major facilitator superfamily (MFS) profile domain-containing protein n=1 Tax=Zasmidium cellare ATCC 36951 TaxID=1080233 RepID=A0A6A6C531_ZASCE|nr:uncharacterized protein M409DRAFT_29117 [Zasmidium cellare ATCC 36951]KAF2160496.1 hypothetical protein M409DRAFT_29117 [Zasmidium cellare ATCC 36951]
MFLSGAGAEPEHDQKTYNHDVHEDFNPVTSDTVLKDQEGHAINSTGQDGVKKAQATTIVWSRNALLVVYALIFLIFFINSFQQQTSNNLVVYVTSSFTQVYLIPTVGIVSTIVAGVIKLPVAKLMDIFGRPQGYVFMLTCAVLGLVLMAACNNITTYAAAQVFYWVGFNGIGYVLDVFIADTSSLQWRALLFAFTTSPYIATTFAGPAAAQSFLRTSGWRWGYGVYAILVPVISAPFLAVFWYNQRLARKQGILVPAREASGRTWTQSLVHYFIEFDFIGILLICAGFSLFLLPFSLATSSAQQWRSGHIIAMLAVGVVLLIAFGVWEKFFAKKPFLPFHYLTDRTVLGSCLLPMTTWISFYCWDGYFNPYLQTVHNLSVTNAGYVANIYNLGSCFWALIVGVLIRYSGRFKWIALAAVPFEILGTGLMIHFREASYGIGYVVMTQIFIAFAGGTLVICQEIAIMAAVGPANIAVALALQGLFASVGGAIGSSISGAIWTNTFYKYLVANLPQETVANATVIYSSITSQLLYPPGDPTRIVIDEGYVYAQQYMCIAGTAILSLCFIWVLMWKDYQVKDFKAPPGAKVF